MDEHLHLSLPLGGVILDLFLHVDHILEESGVETLKVMPTVSHRLCHGPGQPGMSYGGSLRISVSGRLVDG